MFWNILLFCRGCFRKKNIFLKHGITENATDYKVTLCRPSGFVVAYTRYCHAYMIRKKFGISFNFRAVLPVWSPFFQKKMHRKPYIFLRSILREFGAFYTKRVISRSWKHVKHYCNYSYRVKPPPSTFFKGDTTPLELIFIFSLHFLEKTRKFGTKFHMDLIKNVKGTQKLQSYFSKDNYCGPFSSKKKCVKINIWSINLKLLILSYWFFFSRAVLDSLPLW